jgi:hypothetical protein
MLQEIHIIIRPGHLEHIPELDILEPSLLENMEVVQLNSLYFTDLEGLILPILSRMNPVHPLTQLP